MEAGGASGGPRLLVIAGHDSSGGAGIDADRHAAEAAGAEVRCVVTAWTKQGASGVTELGAVEPAAWRDEGLAAAAWGPRAVKFGLLPGAGAVSAARELLDGLRSLLGAALPVVLDPVIAASSGRRFLDAGGLRTLRAELLPAGVVLTPNLPEAEALCALEVGTLTEDLEARIQAAGALLEAGARAVLLKGGHGGEDPVRDLVAPGGGGVPRWLCHPRVPGGGIRGSGCRFASAVAAHLAGGMALEEAARLAGEWVAARVREGG